MLKGWKIIVIYLVFAAVLLYLAPAEQTLGQWVKLIYFHGMLSYASIYAFYASGVLGAANLLLNKPAMGLWSGQLGTISVWAWVVSFLLSLVSMQVAWGGLMWTEPRTLVALFIVVLGIGKEILSYNGGTRLKSAANLVFAVAVVALRLNMGRVMHPENPIGAADSAAIRLFPYILLAATLLMFVALTYKNVSEILKKD